LVVVRGIAAELGFFGTPDPDRVSRTFTYNFVTLNTAVKFAFRGARWLPGRIGQGADPVSQDSIAEALAYASEHADGISPELFVDFIFNDAATRFGNAELRELAVQTGMLEWWTSTWTDMRNATRTRKWCKNWIRGHDLRLDLGTAIEEERLNFATRKVIGRWFERFGPTLTSVNPRLLFNYDETMLAAHFRRNKVIVQLDQRVFRKKNKKPHHFTLGAVFNPFGHGPSPSVVVPTFSGAEELFAGQPVLIGESRSGWSTGPIFIGRHP